MSLHSTLTVDFGGTSGIGQGIAAAFLHKGAKVVVMDRPATNDLDALHCQADVTTLFQHKA